SDDVTSVYLTGRRLDRFSFRAGQYANVGFLTKGLWAPHPFSFSAAPNGRFVRISIKAVGDFTRRIRHLAPGSVVLLEGPLGAFTAGASIGRKYLMVAGGIGITPIRALIESLAAGDGDVLLSHSNTARAEYFPARSGLHTRARRIFDVLESAWTDVADRKTTPASRALSNCAGACGGGRRDHRDSHTACELARRCRGEPS